MSPDRSTTGIPYIQDPAIPVAYSAFSKRQKHWILGLAAFAGWFSSVSSFIYFPAIPYVASDLGVSTAKINLTVTSYLIMSGIIPSIVGDAADRFGRRPVFIVALTIYVCANIGLALQSNFTALFLLRMVQSAGISGTFSVTYGVLGDLFTPAERGGYSGTIAFFLNTPPSIGPIISGLFLLRWSWRSVFWFLTATTPCCLIPMVLFLPETARSIVGDGTISTSGINRPLLSFLVPKTSSSHSSTSPGHQVQGRLWVPNPIASLRLLKDKETAIMLAAYGFGYAIYSCLQASLSTLFLEIYQVSGFTAGLIYIPFGVACASAALGTGIILDWNYRKTAKELGFTIDKTRAEDLLIFPIEKARIRTIKPLVFINACLIAGYGWLLEKRVSMAGPLVLQFFVGLTIQSMFTALNTLIVDIHQKNPSTAQAACNLVRCELAAGFLAALGPLLGWIGPGWTFVILAAFTAFVIVPGLATIEKYGLGWRQQQASLIASSSSSGTPVMAALR